MLLFAESGVGLLSIVIAFVIADEIKEKPVPPTKSHAASAVLRASVFIPPLVYHISEIKSRYAFN